MACEIEHFLVTVATSGGLPTRDVPASAQMRCKAHGFVWPLGSERAEECPIGQIERMTLEALSKIGEALRGKTRE